LSQDTGALTGSGASLTDGTFGVTAGLIFRGAGCLSSLRLARVRY